MTVEYKVISIGALSRNSFWGETEPVRTPHATTTLIVSGNKKILVDPALPGPVLNARLFERAGIRNADITTVFLTTFRAAHRGALSAFDQAQWFIHEHEKEYAQKYLKEILRGIRCDCDEHRGHPHHHPDEPEAVEGNLVLLDRCREAPEKLADQVAIFPSPGASAGCCGLLLTPPLGAIVVAGDAVINGDYLEHGKVWDQSADIKQAQRSLEDILEVADLIIPGHDNLIPLLGKIL